MYFDAVLTEDMYPVFNGTSDEVCTWLTTHTVDVERDNVQVCDGRTMQMHTVADYLAMHGGT